MVIVCGGNGNPRWSFLLIPARVTIWIRQGWRSTLRSHFAPHVLCSGECLNKSVTSDFTVINHAGFFPPSSYLEISIWIDMGFWIPTINKKFWYVAFSNFCLLVIRPCRPSDISTVKCHNDGVQQSCAIFPTQHPSSRSTSCWIFRIKKNFFFATLLFF